LDFRRADDYVQAHLRQCIVMHRFCHPGGLLSPPARSLLLCLLRHDAFNRHGFGDCASFDLCSYQHKTYGISTRGL
jgi:hypothetical protein